jgi:hypothetical protein
MSIKPLFVDPLSNQSINTSSSKPNLNTQSSNNNENNVNLNTLSSRSSANKSIQAPSVAEARKLLNDQIIASLDKTLTQSNQTSLFELDPADFTPEKVAERILSFVGAAFSDIETGDKTAQLEKLEQARVGIEKGFNDAKDILEGFGVFKDEIADNANETYDLLQQGLNKIAVNIESGVSVLEGLFNRDNSLNNVYNTERATILQQSFEFELTTKDGDNVIINVNHLEASHNSGSRTEADDGSITALNSASLTQSGYSISFDGQFDNDELDAIDKVLKDLTGVVNRYFSGDTQASLEQVSNLGYNTVEIASFSLNLKEIQQTRATSVYQQVSELGSKDVGSANLGQFIKPLQEYATQLSEVYRDFIRNQHFDNTQNQFQQLLDQIVGINHLATDKNELDQFNRLNTEILQRIA